MVDSKVGRSEARFNPHLPHTVHIANGIDEALALNPEKLFLDGDILAIDGVDWNADFEPLRACLSPRWRRFDEPFKEGKRTPEASAELEKLGNHAKEILRALYPNWSVVSDNVGWRNQPSGPEPMHLDSYNVKGCAIACTFVNLDRSPRSYDVGWRLPDFCDEHRKFVQDAMPRWIKNGQTFAVEMRDRWIRKKEPFDKGMPTHSVNLAPKTIWMFDPKRIFHQMIRGNGVMTVSWKMPDSGAPSQDDILKNYYSL